MAAWFGNNGRLSSASSTRITTVPVQVAPNHVADTDSESWSESESDTEEPDIVHEISDLSYGDQDTEVMTCIEHLGLELNLYCTTHDAVVCKTCSTQYHR